MIDVSFAFNRGQIAADEDFESVEVPKVSFYLKQRKIFINLVLMSLCWLASSFGYYLLLTLVNTFDKVYTTAFTDSFADMTAYILSGLLFEKIGVKLSLILSFLLSTVGGIACIAWALTIWIPQLSFSSSL